jgi:hypothetical protein
VTLQRFIIEPHVPAVGTLDREQLRAAVSQACGDAGLAMTRITRVNAIIDSAT